LGVIEAYRLVKREFSNVQLVLIGATDRYLINNVEDYAAQTIHLLHHLGERGQFGRRGVNECCREFLLPRLARDELRLIRDII
jgi:hypothetical protein